MNQHFKELPEGRSSVGHIACRVFKIVVSLAIAKTIYEKQQILKSLK